MNNIQGKLPIIISMISFPGIIGLAIFKYLYYQDMHLWFGGAMVALYLLWLIVESRIAAKEVEMKQTSKDKGTLEFYVILRMLTVLTLFCFPTVWLWESTTQMIIGSGLFLSGVLFRLWGIRTLGAFYSHRVRLRNDHQVIDFGPYSVVRHPAYTGMILAHTGFVLFFLNWMSLILLFAIFVPAIITRILVEEKVLHSLKGYPAYALRKKRLIPFVW